MSIAAPKLWNLAFNAAVVTGRLVALPPDTDDGSRNGK